MRTSCKPDESNGTPEWLRNQTAPMVAHPPNRRNAAEGYQGHHPLVQKEIEDEKTSQLAQPQILLRSYRQQRPPDIAQNQLRLDQNFDNGETTQLIARSKQIAGYSGFHRGKMCKENLGDLERTSELEILLRQLSKGVNGVTFASYDVLRNTPKESMQQQLHGTQRPSVALAAGVTQHKRMQSAETAYADAYCKMNQGIGPYASKDKHETAK
eukprot:CAMPEP_0114346378 /NCGR_PEP_ID=MMETSP0101-20121206/13019_1 /TAXON_ID=38822 ORGANISM="Pteridomonas danica, Strain PT" /NCGR_SAMPLE_ID=MMETSP0101 /ASSEMBLY_ACC=CAM_ASM_000211 /LENGTH=211 /DNA_ID=CAMNT_0001482985 /DNA_START=1 /DNA_END=636 /DNA_ORIENTATION=+